jgi:phosphohistidine phosphatase
MQLVIVRHAEAETGSPDALRLLTAAGREHARSLGAQLLEQGVTPDVVVSSPLVRARETAAELADAFGLEGPEIDDRLVPGASPADIRNAVRGRGATVVVVAHQPDCGRAAAAFTGGPEPALPPGGYVRLELSGT